MQTSSKILVVSLLSSLALTACGGGSGSDNNNSTAINKKQTPATETPKTLQPKPSKPTIQTSNGLSLTINRLDFDIAEGKPDDFKYITWIKNTFSKEGVTQKEKDIYGKYNDDEFENITSYMVADGFIHIEKDIPYQKDTGKIGFDSARTGKVAFDVPKLNQVDTIYMDDNSPANKIIETTIYKDVSIAGYNKQQTIDTNSYTYLKIFNKIPNKATFPKGSTCKAPMEKLLSRNYYSFSIYDSILLPYTSLEKWQEESSKYYRKEPYKLVKKSINTGKKVIILAQLIDGNKKTDKKAILVDGKLYRGDWELIQSYTVPMTYCIGYNDIAIQYINSQIKRYYKSK